MKNQPFIVGALCAMAWECLADYKPLEPSKVKHPQNDAAPAASPMTYPDEAGFAERRARLIDALSKPDLSKWRQGYFRGGDPGKYLPPHAMARLLKNPTDADALQYMNDERSPAEHYHFAAVNWARFYPMFGDVLTDATKSAFAANAARAGTYCSTSCRGTENHHVMQLSSGVVLPDYVQSERFGGRDRQGCQDEAKKWLKWYVKNLYLFGQGEWDSSIYMMFDVNGLLNIYDFSKDDQSRLLARAGLDWFGAAYALKYVNGMHTGPKERGWSSEVFDNISDHTGWLWWNSTVQPDAKKMENFRCALHAATSAWRPNRVLCNIAQRKTAGLPVEFRNSKPDYWHGLDKPPHPKPILGLSPESLYITRHYTLGTMWYDPDTCTQLTRMQLGAVTPDGTVAFTGSAPGSYNGQPKYTSGQGTHITRTSGDVDPHTDAIYVQYAQSGPVVVCMAQFPERTAEQFTYFTTPVEPVKQDNMWLMHTGSTFVAVIPLTSTAEQTILGGKIKALKFPGRRSGWIMVAGDTDSHKGVQEFAAAVRNLKHDSSSWESEMKVAINVPGGTSLTMKYAQDAQKADAWIDGRKVDLSGWPVYDGPFVQQRNGILTVTDGKERFTIDFSGDMPVYRE